MIKNGNSTNARRRVTVVNGEFRVSLWVRIEVERILAPSCVRSSVTRFVERFSSKPRAESGQPLRKRVRLQNVFSFTLVLGILWFDTSSATVVQSFTDVALSVQTLESSVCPKCICVN